MSVFDRPVADFLLRNSSLLLTVRATDQLLTTVPLGCLYHLAALVVLAADPYRDICVALIFYTHDFHCPESDLSRVRFAPLTS